VEGFMPLTLQEFHRNENAYLNRALALGVLNHFLDSKSLEVFEERVALTSIYEIVLLLIVN